MTGSENHRVGLVLGAGGHTGGAFLRAALDELHARTGWSPEAAERIVSTSAGGFVAAEVPAGPVPCTASQFGALRDLANGADYRGRLGDRPVTAVRRAGGRVVAAIAPSGRPQPAYRSSTPPHHPQAYAVTVTKPLGQRVVHRFVDAADSQQIVRASAAVPFAVGPVSLDGDAHLDGAVHSPNSVDLVEADAYDLVIVISAMIPDSGGPALGRVHRAQLRREVVPWVRADKPVVAVLPSSREYAARKDEQAFRIAGRSAVERLGRSG